MAEKSRASRMAVARPMPRLAPVMDASAIWECGTDIPEEWYEGDRAGLNQLVDALYHRRTAIRGLIEKFRESTRNPLELYIIAGPNGAGKTTFAREFLPNYADCKNFVNADLIAQGMAPFSPETAALRAGRTMLDEIRSFAGRRVSFAFEITLSGRSYLTLLRRLKSEGYEIPSSSCGLRALILRCQESKKESQEADTMCPKQLSDGVLIGPCETFCFTIVPWLGCGRCSTTQARSPT
jgi:hypothetical protein